MVSIVSQNQAIRDQSNGRLTSIVGGVVAVFSLLGAAIILFTPIACSFVGSIQILFLGFLFIAGLVMFLIGLPSLLRTIGGRNS